ncbi:MAG TPA: peptidoglycan DD-metalloendopeptidase family protein [Acidimicrobiales bacterium]|nr:peptidoglycan DD-metalloendopeptidase family protein [Acidimicrobiales bacterium]
MIRCLRLLAPLVGAVLLAVPTAAASAPTAGEAPYEHADEYPDAPGPGTESAPVAEAGTNEDANWVPFLGNRELWCTNGNPGYSGCAGHHGYQAIDIGMPVGTRVHAAGPGRIAAAGSSGDARGTYVDIEHDDGIHSRYYHLSSEVVNVNQRVERGTVIGRSGMTGRTSSPHLHYEERTAGGALKDPGVMFGTVDGRLVSYPPARYGSWWATPYGTRIVNESFAIDNTSLYWGGPGVATGDFDGDGVDDLVTGIPGEDTQPTGSCVDGPNTIDSGAAYVLRGGAAGVATAGAERIFQGCNDIPGAMANNEVFGASVATGDFDGDEHDDLAVGAPAATVQGQRAAGEVVVLYGSPGGLLPVTTPGLLLGGLVPESGDQFGASLTTGDFDGDGDDELVVGSPGEGVARRAVAGAVTVFEGSPDGLGTAPREIHAGTTNVAGVAKAGDRPAGHAFAG